MKMVVDAERLSDGIWLAPLSNFDALRIGIPEHSKNGCSVVLLNAPCIAAGNSISFEPDTATLLNIGNLDFSVFIEASRTPPTSHTLGNTRESKRGYAMVKEQCQKHLPRDLAERALGMLDSLSNDSSDDLIADKTNRWISRPDNYFTIKVQPQNKDLVVTVRGRPIEYESKTLEVRPDQNGYSKFWIRNVKDVQEALRLIRSARLRGRLR
jgi:hypothetical protein